MHGIDLYIPGPYPQLVVLSDAIPYLTTHNTIQVAIIWKKWNN